MEVNNKKENIIAQKELPLNRDLMNVLRLILVILTLAITTLIVTGWGIYKMNWQNSFVNSVAHVVLYPVAAINYGNWISFDEYNKNIQSIRTYLESKEAAYKGSGFDFSTEEGLKRLSIIKKNVLNQLIENRIVMLLAKEKGINVSDEEVKETTSKILTRDGQEKENLTQLSLLYGWNAKDFQDRVIENLLYREKLEELIKNKGELDKEAKIKLAEVFNRIKNGDDFAQIAKDLSESPSRQYGGLLPAFTKDEAPENFANTAFKLNQGEISDSIEGTDGWHVIKIERKFQENGLDKVELRNIFIKRDSFNNWLKEQKKKFKVQQFLPTYFWHQEMGKLYFKDDSLNKLEDDINRSTLDEKLQEADFLLNTSKTIKK